MDYVQLGGQSLLFDPQSENFQQPICLWILWRRPKGGGCSNFSRSWQRRWYTMIGCPFPPGPMKIWGAKGEKTRAWEIMMLPLKWGFKGQNIVQVTGYYNRRKCYCGSQLLRTYCACSPGVFRCVEYYSEHRVAFVMGDLWDHIISWWVLVAPLDQFLTFFYLYY